MAYPDYGSIRNHKLDKIQPVTADGKTQIYSFP